MTSAALHTAHSLAELQEAFGLFDKDGDGTITWSELQSVMFSLGQEISQQQAIHMINSVDTDGNGLIDFEEFCEMMSEWKPCGSSLTDTMEEWRSLFNVFDKDKSGFIDGAELKSTMATVGLQLSDKDVNVMMKAAGVRSSDHIYYHDFAKMMNTKLGHQQDPQPTASAHSSSCLSNVGKSNREQIQELKAVFGSFDKDGDGFITVKEVTEVLTSMDVHCDVSYIHKIFKQVDLDGNGEIDFDEFLVLVKNCDKPLSESSEIRDMFNAIDKDRSGFVDISELKATFVSLGVPLTNSDVRDMMKHAGVKDGRIFYEDFVHIIMTQLHGNKESLPRGMSRSISSTIHEALAASPATFSHAPVSDNKLKELYIQFAQLDKDGDGRISCDELTAVMAALGLNVKQSEIKRILLHSDMDKNGTIDFSEFCDVMKHYKNFKAESNDSGADSEKVDVKQVFKIFDKNSDGFIDEEELRATMRDLGMTLTSDDIVQMFREAGCKDSQRISYQEFVDMMQNGVADTARLTFHVSQQNSSQPAQVSVDPTLNSSQSSTCNCGAGVSHARSLVRGDSATDSSSKATKTQQSPTDTWTAFKVFDRNSDGYVSKSELYHTLKELGVNLTLDELNRHMQAADSNQDGRIDYAEFCSLMKGAFRSFARQAVLLHRQKSVTETSVEQSVVDRSKHRQNLKLCFDEVDENHCGRIDASQLFTAAKNIGLKLHSKQHAQALINKYGSKGDGRVCFNEFKLIQSHCEAGRQRLMSERSRDAEQRMRTAFKVFDIDSNGFIDAQELKSTLHQLGGQFSQADAEEMLQAADRNGDGQIDYEEFILMMYP